jgi:alkyl sulfatase BDS1-like metallo-beta-lactamase superfamily hydrolase
MTDLPFNDTADFTDADRGFIAALTPAVVTAADGRVVWDGEAYAFLAGDCPPGAHPSLWRQGQLCVKQGLYEVTLVEGQSGVIVIDPLVSAETAAAALALYREHRGDRPVTGLIYTHSHVDHFGGARGVLPHGHAPVPILAPQGFLEHAVAENVYAGPAMSRRALYMYGAALERGPAGQIGCGLGMTNSTGTITLIPPTVDITRTGQEETIDGVRMVFQLTPGTEAPAEMNFLFPDWRALCLAENATHNMHNILTLRGAVVRDARIWAHYLDEALALFADQVEVAFASHHWPSWSRERIVDLVAGQRDLYAYLHDQTLHLLNQGLTGAEIAEELQLPPALERCWANRGYYGSLSHNVKAIYQRYMGWFDGNPAHLWEHPPVGQAQRYAQDYGGVEALVAKGKAYAAAGDLRFAATLLGHAVFAEPAHAGAREALAAVYQALGQGAENGPWRNFYLMGAQELRDRIVHNPVDLANAEIAGALSVDMLIDSLAVRINGPKAWDTPLILDWHVTDEGRVWRLRLSNGALTHRSTTPDRPHAGAADATYTLTKAQLLGVLAGQQPERIEVEGDPQAWARLAVLLDVPDVDFPIVTP